jgi:membrane protein involved in colicin uptake
VKTKADADRAAIWADRLKKIASKAVAFHKVEKQPFLDGGRAVDEKWRGLKEEPGTVVDALRAHVKPYFAELKRQEEERQRIAREKAEQERREAEEKARAAREAAAKAEEGDLAAEKARQEAEDAARRAKEAEKEAEARKVSAGRTGARMGMKTETVYVVTDYLKAATAMLALGNTDLKTEIDRLAKRLMKAGVPLDGVEARDEEVVR